MKKLIVVILAVFSLSACAHGDNRGGYGYNHPNRGWGVPVGTVIAGTLIAGAIYQSTHRPTEYVVQQPVYVQQPQQIYVDPVRPVPVCTVVPVMNEYGQIVSYRQVCQ